MYAIALVVFREVLEIALIVGVLLAATKSIPKRSQWVYVGCFMGILGSGIIALCTDSISQAFNGVGQEILNAIILIVAAMLIGWTTIWMNLHGRRMNSHFKKIGTDLITGRKPLYTLATVIGLSVLREGAEIVMFTYSAAMTGEPIKNLLIGSLLGCFVGVLIGFILYQGLIRIPIGRILRTTSYLLIFIIAGMLSKAFGFLSAAGIIPEITPMLWNSSQLISSQSALGEFLYALFGYTDKPTGIQALVYILTIGGAFMVLGFYSKTNNVVNKTNIVIIATIGILILLSPQAHATKRVYSPYVEKGEVEIEARGQYDIDERSSKDNNQKHKYALGYGVSDFWFTEIYCEIERTKNADDEDLDFSFTSLSLENKFQLTEPGKYWADVGAYVEYEASFENKHPDNIESKLLLAKSIDKFTHMANFTLEQNVGRHPNEDLVGGFAWSSRYRFNQYIEPGFEWHSNFGEIGQTVSYQDQTHQYGPALYGKLGKIKYDVGYLFGASDAAPKGEIKWILEYEGRF